MATTKQQTRGGLLLSGRDHYSEIAARIGRSKTLVGYWCTGERHPSEGDIAAIAEAYGIPEAAWTEPAYPPGASTTPASTPAEPASRPYLRTDSPLVPWLQRLLHEGTSVLENDEDEVERTVQVIADTCTEHPAIGGLVIAAVLEKHPELIADVLATLRPYA